MSILIEIGDDDRRAVAARNGRAGLATDGEVLVEFWLAIASIRKEMVSDLMRLDDCPAAESKASKQHETALPPSSSWAAELTSGSW
jgi:hypothetical protein